MIVALYLTLRNLFKRGRSPDVSIGPELDAARLWLRIEEGKAPSAPMDVPAAITEEEKK